jgi:flagellar basal body rod protein FlgG
MPITERLSADTDIVGDLITADPTLTGSAVPNVLLTLTEGGQVLGTTIADGLGAWRFRPTGLAAGPHTIVVGNDLHVAVQGAGYFQTQLPTGEIAYTQDGTFALSATGQIVTADGNVVLPGITIPTGALAVTIDSTGAVQVLLDGQPTPILVGDIQLANFANVAGLVPIGAGLFQASANSGAPVTGSPGSSGLGTISPAETASLSFTLDTSVPQPAEQLANDTASPTDVVTSDATLTGLASPNQTLLFTEGAVILGTVTADTSGIWTFAPPNLADGTHVIAVGDSQDLGLAIQGNGYFQIQLPSGEFGYTRDGTFSLSQTGQIVTVDGNAAQPGITVPSNATAIAIDSHGAVQVLLEGNLQTVGNIQLALFTNPEGLTALGGNLFQASAGSGSPVVGSPGSSGFGSIMQPGASDLSFTLDTTTPGSPTIQGLATGSDSGTDGDRITNVAQPTVAGTAEAGATIMLFADAAPVGTATAETVSGDWSITASALSEGAHLLTATSTDQAGNISETAALDVTIDTAPPPITEALAVDTGASNGDGITADPTLTGAGDPNAVVTLSEDNIPFATTVAELTGAWTFTPILPDGLHTIVASETDLAGNLGTASLSFTLNTAAPNSWIDGTADWQVPADWNSGLVPVSTDDVLISNPGTYTVTLSAGEDSSVNTLIVDAAGATLELQAKLVVTGGIAVNAGTLDVSNNALFGAAITIASGATIGLASARVVAGTGGIDVQSGGLFTVRSGFNQIASITNDGIVSTGGGGHTLLIDGPMTGSGIFSIGAGGDELLLAPQSSATSSVKVDFTGGPTAGSTLQLDSANTFSGEISGFELSDQILLRNQIVTNDIWTENGAGTGGTLTIDYTTDGTPAQEILSFHGAYNQSSFAFAPTSLDDFASTQLTTDTPCFLRGTRILTPRGERPIEALQAGDLVVVLEGVQRSRPIRWIGRRRIVCASHSAPELIWPIRIHCGAFADAVPHRDLLVSPDHAIFVDGQLICARQLVNGTTISQEMGYQSVDYFHVELDDHAILLAEGLPAESYLNTGNHGFFANSGQPLVLHPDLTDESDYPTRTAGSCAPFVSDEASVRPVWQRLAKRAAALGQPVPVRETTSDPGLLLLAKGRKIKPIFANADLAIFVLPRDASEVGVVSRAASPTDVRPWLEDRRQLGVRVARIVLRGADEEVREIPVDHPALGKGWWAIERDGRTMRRWTNGEAVLPLPAKHGDAMLEIHLAGTMIYAVEAAPADEAARRVA